MIKNIYNPIIKKIGQGRPIVLVVGCVHGDEPVGKKVIDKLNKLNIKRGTLITIIAHPFALKKKKRYIDLDLNRCFDSHLKNRVEIKIAHIIKPYLQLADYVIDIHTASHQIRSMLIIKKANKKLKKLLSMINEKNIVLMGRTIGRGSLINQAKAGVSFEFGEHGSRAVLENNLKNIKNILLHFNMLDDYMSTKLICKKNYYKVYDIYQKPEDFILSQGVKDFGLVKKGRAIGSTKSKLIRAPDSFYPVLFSDHGYNNIIGFKAHKINKL